MRVAVVGHVEWMELLHLDHVPRPGEIVHATPAVAVPAGGGGVAAVQLARWGAEAALFTALGEDDLGHRAAAGLRSRGVAVHAVHRAAAQRRAITLVDAARERTIVVLGSRLVPHASDALPWGDLAGCAAVYLTGGDAGAVRAARAARVLVATARVLPLLREAGVVLDALVGSEDDPAEAYAPGDLDPPPRLVVRTAGARGGWYAEDGGPRRPCQAVPAEGPRRHRQAQVTPSPRR